MYKRQPKAHGAFLYQLRRLHRRRIEGYFIRPAAQHLPDGIDITDPAAYGKGNEHLLCRALYDIKHRASALVRSVDIQEGDLICAQLAVTPQMCIRDRSQLDTEGVSVAPEADHAVVRADEIAPSLPKQAVIELAPETDGDGFLIPRIV